MSQPSQEGLPGRRPDIMPHQMRAGNFSDDLTSITREGKKFVLKKPIKELMPGVEFSVRNLNQELLEAYSDSLAEPTTPEEADWLKTQIIELKRRMALATGLEVTLVGADPEVLSHSARLVQQVAAGYSGLAVLDEIRPHYTLIPVKDPNGSFSGKFETQGDSRYEKRVTLTFGELPGDK